MCTLYSVTKSQQAIRDLVEGYSGHRRQYAVPGPEDGYSPLTWCRHPAGAIFC
jgi:hypothetical protein